MEYRVKVSYFYWFIFIISEKVNLIIFTSDNLTGPPVPPRPPKTLIMSRDLTQKDPFQGPKIQEPNYAQDTNSVSTFVVSLNTFFLLCCLSRVIMSRVYVPFFLLLIGSMYIRHCRCI